MWSVKFWTSQQRREILQRVKCRVMSVIEGLELFFGKERLRGLELLAWRREGLGVILLMQRGNEEGRTRCFSVLPPTLTQH